MSEQLTKELLIQLKEIEGGIKELWNKKTAVLTLLGIESTSSNSTRLSQISQSQVNDTLVTSYIGETMPPISLQTVPVVSDETVPLISL